MKNLYILLCGLLVITTGCTIERLDHVKTFDCFSVSLDNSELTKVHMEAGGVMRWDESESITVYSDIQGPVCYKRGEDGLFSGKPVSGTVFYAFYTYDSFFPILRYDNENPAILNWEQTSITGNCEGNTQWILPIVARSTGNKLDFKQTLGVIRFRIHTEQKDLRYITFSGNCGEALTGKGAIDLSQDNPVFTLSFGEETSTEVNAYRWGLDSDNNVWTFYVPLPVMTLQNGFTLEISYRDEGNPFTKSIKKTTSNPVSIERGVMRTFTLVDLDAEIQAEDNAQRNALIALYNATDGDHWKRNDNWCSDKPLEEWFGIHTDYNGNVYSIDLSNNDLNGTLPLAFWGLTNLQCIHFYGNSKLSGVIPPDIIKLKRLEAIDIGYCSFNGTLPTELGALENLTNLTLYANDFSGSIPKTLGNLTSIRKINLGCNKLSGNIPEELGKLKDLPNFKSLGLSGNELTGSIPKSFAGFSNNVHISLKYNRLSGRIPDGFIEHDGNLWPFLLAQIGEGLDRSGLTIKGPVFSAVATDGTVLDNSIFSRNQYTLLFEFTLSDLPFYQDIINLYRNYKKKGLEVIGYCAGFYDKTISDFASIEGFPWKNFGFDGGSDNSITIAERDITDPSSRVYMLENRYAAVNVVNSNGDIVFDPYYTGTPEYECTHNGFFYVNKSKGMPLAIDSLKTFIAERLGDPDPIDIADPADPYHSTDYSTDGSVHTLQTATVGNGIDIVLMGDVFSDRMIADGSYDKAMKEALDAFFSEEPFKSYQDYFNVYSVDVVAPYENYRYGNSAFSIYYGEGSSVGGDYDKIIEYTKKAIPDNRMDDALVIVIINDSRYAGTCHMYQFNEGDYGRGLAISFVPLRPNYKKWLFPNILCHESGGHGFAKLADEYSDSDTGEIPDWLKGFIQFMEPNGWFKNIDFTPDPLSVKWAQFISDYRYAAERIGVYEGGYAYQTGVWHPTLNSMMNDEGGFNAPSRYAIWYRINKLAFGPEWNGTYEDFVEYDAVNRTPAANQRRIQRTLEAKKKNLPPLAPPVVLEDSWQSARH